MIYFSSELFMDQAYHLGQQILPNTKLNNIANNKLNEILRTNYPDKLCRMSTAYTRSTLI